MTLGRMDPGERAKGFDEIIELLPRLAAREPAIRYLCAGDGGDRVRLEAKAQSLGVADRVVFTGRIAESRKADHFRLSDAYIMPSRWEGFGFVVVEALACGIPVVASTKDGTREAVRNGELGLLVDPKDADSLEQAILDALSRPKAVPPGLDYFSFANFEKRLAAALSNVAPGLV
jgi:glycosyltransferase involved in cell wall biosynthesis